MGNTVPNQRVINVHREAVKSDFLGIKNANWMAAGRDLGPHGLRLYLYLAANADGYRLALSPAAITNAVGMPRSTYQDYFKIMEAKGYLVQAGGNTYDFYEVPQPRAATEEKENAEVAGAWPTPSGEKALPQTEQPILPEDIEININRADKAINNDCSFEEWYQPDPVQEQEEEVMRQRHWVDELLPVAKQGEYVF